MNKLFCVSHISADICYGPDASMSVGVRPKCIRIHYEAKTSLGTANGVQVKSLYPVQLWGNSRRARIASGWGGVHIRSRGREVGAGVGRESSGDGNTRGCRGDTRPVKGGGVLRRCRLAAYHCWRGASDRKPVRSGASLHRYDTLA